MNKLFIDDERVPGQNMFGFDIVRSYDDAIAYMQRKGCPGFISFDHDLSENANSKTGYDIAKWIVEQDLNAAGKFIPDDFAFYVHSANPPGRDNIQGLLDRYLKFKLED